nr:hypothetical protein [Tanacetum cinerariifolium]
MRGYELTLQYRGNLIDGKNVSEGEACPTESGFIEDQDRATIVKSSTLPHDSTTKVTSLAADEGSMQHNIYELKALCTSLQMQYSELQAKFQAQEEEIVKLKDRVKVLEDREGVVAKQSGDDAPIKGRSINERKAAAERISNDSEEIARVLTSMDAATVLAGGIDVPTGSGFIPPATVISTGSEVGLIASPIVTRRKGKEVMVESDTPKKKKLQEQIDAQIARDAEVARIHAEEELQGMIDSLDQSNETIAKYLQEYQDFASELPLEKRIELISDLVKYQDNYSKVYKFQSQQRRPTTKKQKREYYMAVIKSNLGWSDLVKYQDNYSKVYKFQSQQRRPMTKKQKREYYMAVIKSNLGWKFKDFKGMTFEEIEAKFAEVWKQVEDFIPIGSKEETERLKRKGLNLEKEQLVLVEDVYVQALQVKHPIIDWKVQTEGQRSYWQIIRLGGSSACYQFFVDLLKQLDREDLNQLWALVNEYLSIRPATCEKEMELWVELKRMYEPDPEDQLWTLT